MRERMEDLIEDLYFLDVKLVKGEYTWNNRQVGIGYIVAHLDRFLVHGDFFKGIISYLRR
jgi:hypothetical protein